MRPPDRAARSPCWIRGRPVRRAAAVRSHAGHHFVEIERLDDVVIGAGIEAGNPLPNLIARVRMMTGVAPPR